MVLGICSFAFAGVKAAPPHGKRSSSGGLAPAFSRGKAPAWLLGFNILPWDCLAIQTQNEIIKYQKNLRGSLLKYYRFYSNTIFKNALDSLCDLINMGSSDDEKNNIRRVIGFYPHPNGNKNLMYIKVTSI